MKLSVLWRGPLASCNYGCPYCPFAKRVESDEDHARDADALARFCGWVEAQEGRHRLSIFFTPWGEALIRRRYQKALAALTRLSHVEKVAIQTNLSCRLDWTETAQKSKLGLWATYHPAEISRAEFLARCRSCDERNLRYSVGVVGLKEHFGEIEALRAALPPHVYLWVNAYKRVEGYYSESDIAFLQSLDPLFGFNNTRHPSRGGACRTGESVFSVDGAGVMRRCHFVKAPIGNIFEAGWEAALMPRPCPNETCGCHIGYVHRPALALDEIFGTGILERIPEGPRWQPLALI